MRRKLQIALQISAIFALSFVVIYDATQNMGTWWTLYAVCSLVSVCLITGWSWGQTHLLKVRMTDCIGGPLDGNEVPVPNLMADDARLSINGHDEGEYVYDGARFVWQEDREEVNE